MSEELDPRESMEFDVLVVGAGPGGLSAAIRLKQLNPEISVCVVEKGGEVGAHILSGAVLEPRALKELFPDCDPGLIPLATPVTEDQFIYLTETKAFKSPITPNTMHNEGNYIVSLGNVVRWLGQQAEEAGVEIYPGFAAAEALLENGRIVGVATGDMGVGKDGQPTGNYQRGMELRATYTIFAEGCRGSLSKQLMKQFNLNADNDPQTYAIGVKELWEVKPEHFKKGLAVHTLGWPLTSEYGGAAIYFFGDNLMAYSFVVGLDYTNPFLSPFQEMQRYKTHPAIKPYFEGAKRISYGARALNEGGFQSLPKLTFPGGVLIGCAAGTLNVPKIKGTHTAMKSGMVAAEAIAAALAGDRPAEVTAYPELLKQSWLWPELHAVRNIRPGFAKFGLWGGLINAGLEAYIFKGKMPWTLKNHNDYDVLQKARDAKPIAYPKPDGKLTFDRLSSVFISNTNHEENQPPHLTLLDPSKAITVNWNEYRSPETRYCPAGVYEIVGEESGNPQLQINAQNCVHCKTCDIKDPTQNINWVVPEGAGGPNYPGGM